MLDDNIFNINLIIKFKFLKANKHIAKDFDVDFLGNPRLAELFTKVKISFVVARSIFASTVLLFCIIILYLFG